MQFLAEKKCWFAPWDFFVSTGQEKKNGLVTVSSTLVGQVTMSINIRFAPTNKQQQKMSTCVRDRRLSC